jgi:hypothetical protein
LPGSLDERRLTETGRVAKGRFGARFPGHQSTFVLPIEPEELRATLR